jgi:hypothetical protein
MLRLMRISNLEIDPGQVVDPPPEVASEPSNKPGSHFQPFNISSDEEPSDGGPRRPGRAKQLSRAMQSQQEKIELRL